jgi:alcohol dehydrogenase class IV
MPYVMVFNRLQIEESMLRLASYLELANPSFAAVLDWVMDLRAEFEIPHTIRELGVDDTRFDELAAMAVHDPTAAGNPVALTEAGCRRLLERSFSGELGV